MAGPSGPISALSVCHSGAIRFSISDFKVCAEDSDHGVAEAALDALDVAGAPERGNGFVSRQRAIGAIAQSKRAVCTENFIRIDWLKESRNVSA